MGSIRNPGGGRKPSKPDYNPSVILKEQIDAAAGCTMPPVYSVIAPVNIVVDDGF